jgi:ABC-type transporter Mla MlaB component
LNTLDQDVMKKEQLSASLSVHDGNLIEINGVLDFDTVPALMKEAEVLLQKLNEAKLSFKGVVDSNSAGLALLLELKRYMQSKNKTVIFSDLPEQIRTIARAYGVDAELGSNLGL